MLYLSIGLGQQKLCFRKSGSKWCLALNDVITNKLSVEFLILEPVDKHDIYRVEKPTEEI